MLKRITFAVLFFLLSCFLLYADINNNRPKLLLFYSDTCHACHKVIQEVMPEIEKEFLGKISIEYLDIKDVNNYKLMLELKEKYGCKESGVPTVFLEGKIIVGFLEIKQNLRNLILEVLKRSSQVQLPKEPSIDLSQYFLSFGILPIITAGLIDGINPCAFTVIVFFVSFLSLQKYKREVLMAVGFSFIFAVFLTYILIGVGIFRFLYVFRYFYLFSKILYYLIGILCFVLAVFCFYDIWVFKKKREFKDLTLQLPQIIKNRIHSIIGNYYRRSPLDKNLDYNSQLLKLILSAWIVGFLVSLLEAVCTGQLYLPTIVFMLKEPLLRMRAFIYLILYNIMFIIPLMAVFLFALLGVSSSLFSEFMRKNIILIRVLMAVIFITFGVLIVLKA